MKQEGTYLAHAYHASFEKGRSSGTIQVHSNALSFEGGGKQVRMPLEGLSLTLGGASDRLVFVTHRSYPGWKLYTSDRSILKNRALANNSEVRAQQRKATSKRLIGTAIIVAVFAAIIITPLAILFNMDAISAPIARQVPVEWEESLGESAIAQYKIEHAMLEGELAQQLLSALTQPLVSALEEPRHTYRFQIVQNPQVNAFAVPGGNIVINSGLILAADDASEVQGVLAHEIAHVSEQHGIRQVISTSGTYLVIQAIIGDVSGVLAVIADSAPLLMHQSYSRGFESEADEKALELLSKANINPHGLLTFFDKIKTIQQEAMGQIGDERTREWVTTAEAFLSSHPATDDRIESIREAMADNGNYRDMNKEFLELKALVKTFVANNEVEE